MTNAAPNNADSSATEVAVPDAAVIKSSHQSATEHRVAEISSLLSSLAEAATESGLTTRQKVSRDVPKARHENRLVQVRLGIANSLYTALKHKHSPTAEHSLRVALGCSSWALFAELDDETRDTVELAALMHDIGKIGVPDGVLLKPSRLTSEEMVSVSQHHEMGLEILTNCCSSERVLNVVRYAGMRYDGQHNDLPAKGEDIPLEARMISIVDAFDSMTTDHVYRPAKSRECALSELFECAGKQFDPVLVKQFADVLSQRQDLLSSQVAARWLSDLSSRSAVLPWDFEEQAGLVKVESGKDPRPLFEQKLLDSMYDGVVFVDAQAKIRMWSKGAERMTGVSGGAATGRVFAPSLLDMCNAGSRRISDDACPVAKCIRTNAQLRQRLFLLGRQGEHVAVDLHAIPVQGLDGTVQGATIVLHDAQPEASLEEKCEALHAEVAKDPMTKIANRAEFDRMQALFIEAHQQAGMPCSLIMIDIDHFKRINDTFGHQAGDEAIITLVSLLTSKCRTGDLVARYGGEEFAVLCAGCTNASAARRAEQIRKQLSKTPHKCLGNKRITASFGVTELQAGDTSETMLRRSDRALLMAKQQGRNQVIQLGNGMEKEQPKKKWWSFGSLRTKPVVQTTLTTAVPIDVAIEKLKGFVSDHQAKIVATRENSVELEVSSEHVANNRRKGDRHAIYRVEMQFGEERVQRKNNTGLDAGQYAQTRIKLEIRPKRARSRRRADMAERARLILQSIKAYLMAKEIHEQNQEVVTAETK
ncbi:MAG: diguanylate cyclase [Planctomycetes bacterium]|nr:diguanylate cyclase [Planctomycetota bacterium]